VNIAPIARLTVKPRLKRIPTRNPDKNGMMTPKTQVISPDFLLFFIPSGSVSMPMINMRKIVPINAISLNSGEVKSSWNVKSVVPSRVIVEPDNDPIREGPRITPAKISPMTPGCFIFSQMKLKSFATIRATAMSKRILVAVIPFLSMTYVFAT